MSFKKNQGSLATGNNGEQAQNESWKAQGFINIYVKVGDGKRKVGSIPLKESKAFERALLERLQQEGGVEAFAANLEIDFQIADKETKAAELGW